MKITIEAVPFIEVRLNKRETVELIEVLRRCVTSSATPVCDGELGDSDEHSDSR